MVKLAICGMTKVDYGLVKSILAGVWEKESDFEVYESTYDILKCLDQCGRKHNVFYFDAREPGIDFIEMAKAIRERDRHAYFIFCDITKPDANLIHELAPCEFMHHPLDWNYLNELYRWYCEFRSINKLDYVFQYKNKLYRFSNDDILFIEKDGRKARLYDVLGREFEMYKTTEQLKIELNPNSFVSISRYEIVNLFHVKHIDMYSVVLDDGRILQLARRKRHEVYEKFLNLDHLLQKNDRSLHFVYECQYM